MPVNFFELIGPGGKDEGRHVFERLIVQLVRLGHPAMGIAASPGDWGIDALVGELDEIVSVWQAKYFIDGFGEDQHQQVRESFKAAVKAAEDHDYTIDTWTLCVPVELEPATAQWWSGWRRRTSRTTGIQIDLWTGSALEETLAAPEAEHIARSYFPMSMGAASVPPPATVLPVPAGVHYNDALFIKQLTEAGIAETASAKRQFFNYEVLSREVADKADPQEVQTLETGRGTRHLGDTIRRRAPRRENRHMSRPSSRRDAGDRAASSGEPANAPAYECGAPSRWDARDR
jgi:hypothetical protein